MKLSLITPYRQRKQHLKTQLAWWNHHDQQEARENCELLIIEADQAPSAWIETAIAGTNIRYLFCPSDRIFHKTKLLNLGLNLAQGEFVSPFDVDLIPIGKTLSHHLHLAQSSPCCLVTGYRMMATAESIALDAIPAALEAAAIAPEDAPTALWKHLVRRERFGIAPLFQRQRLIEIGGWDETFIGWGGEDQEVIERYLESDRFLCRCPDLLYLHLSHSPDLQWAEPELIESNRRHYYAKLQSRQRKR